jgi:aminoglycoside 3-N-acetyltransferase
MKNILKKRWLDSGLKENDKILLHSSFKRTFEELKKDGYNCKPEDILESFIDLVSPHGTLVVPTFNFDFNNGLEYNYLSTKSQVGAVTEIARNHKLAARTLNPVYSFAVFGKDSGKFKNIDNESWYSKSSPFKMIHDDNYKICIIDLSDRHSMTFAHYCEEHFQVPWRYYKDFTSKYTDNNNLTKLKTYKGYVRKISENVETTLDPAGELLWETGKYKGFRPFKKSGLRYVCAQDYFNLFQTLFEKNQSNPYYYKTTNL